MEKEDKKYKFKYSLRTVLLLWFLFLSIFPISFITWYSLNKFKHAHNIELNLKAENNKREILASFSKHLNNIKKRNKIHLNDNSLLFYLKRNQIYSLLEITRTWVVNNEFSKISMFDSSGKYMFSTFKTKKNKIDQDVNEFGKAIFISKNFLKSMKNKNSLFLIDISEKETIDLTVVSKILTVNDELAGYLKETLNISMDSFEQLADSLGKAVIVFSKPGLANKITSHKKLSNVSLDIKEDIKIEKSIKNEPYMFWKFKMNWGDDWVFVTLGSSKGIYQKVSKNILSSFLSVVGGIIMLLIALSFLISSTLLRPVRTLVSAINNKRPGDELINIPIKSNTELGLLTKTFNQMFEDVHLSQNQLKENITSLVDVNNEIKDSQSKLVHNEKMASLGQLVAGVAHELNNPIGFIYSNIGHLREYSNSLVKIIEGVDNKEEGLAQLKQENDYDFIVKDLPKLIQSCEDGARRTRDIVLGLRNFSRIEEAKLKEADVTEGIDRTLDLLNGEIKSKITIIKKYGKIPLVHCYPSQLNQVFMNVLVNAIQSISERGEIVIQTKIVNKIFVEISFKDTGKGMNPSTLAKVFDPFFTTKDVGKGTGLGMSISYGIIQKHQGEIQVKSKEGEGTEFIVTLPLSGPKI